MKKMIGVIVFGSITLLISLPWVAMLVLCMLQPDLSDSSLLCFIGWIGFLTMSICSVGVLSFKEWLRRGLIVSMIIIILVLPFIKRSIPHVEAAAGFIFAHLFYFATAIYYFSLAEARELFN